MFCHVHELLTASSGYIICALMPGLGGCVYRGMEVYSVHVLAMGRGWGRLSTSVVP